MRNYRSRVSSDVADIADIAQIDANKIPWPGQAKQKKRTGGGRPTQGTSSATRLPCGPIEGVSDIRSRPPFPPKYEVLKVLCKKSKGLGLLPSPYIPSGAPCFPPNGPADPPQNIVWLCTCGLDLSEFDRFGYQVGVTFLIQAALGYVKRGQAKMCHPRTRELQLRDSWASDKRA